MSSNSNSRSPSVWNSLERLAERVLAGEVVFFIGAGFSLDSEKNYAWVLMTRLLIRFQAMVEVLRRRAPEERLGSLFKKLQQTFSLHEAPVKTRFRWTSKDIDILARDYYETNDWFCTTFEKLLEISYRISQAADLAGNVAGLLGEIEAREEEIRTSREPALVDAPLDGIHLGLPAWAFGARAQRQKSAGKALFLDTMGFADKEIMGGRPWEADLSDVEASYRRKLFPRHHVLARLAREGLCPIVLTTNYDALLEGAWRLAGFAPEEICHSERAEPVVSEMPTVPFDRMKRIGSAREFFRYGKAVRTSLVVKVHGCAGLYRQQRRAVPDEATLPDAGWEPWARYLPAMVFTYREIQNWRDDPWARDFLATMQRTCCVAFLGYSLRDPVIHDAFRTVYEGMSSRESLNGDDSDATSESEDVREEPPCEPEPEDAPAFFFGPAHEDSFHGYEVLHAASHAIGAVPRQVHEHGNYIRFHFLDESSRTTGAFPNLDDAFLWLYHRAIRRRQQRVLRDDLRGVASMLLKKRPKQSELESLERSFSRLCDAENALVSQWDQGQHPTLYRHQLRRVTAWTSVFHPALLKELATVLLIHREGGPGFSLERLRESPWYYPASANPGWLAWTTVVEIALRHALASVAGYEDSQQGLEVRREFRPIEGHLPTIAFCRRKFPDGRHRGAYQEALSLAVRDKTHSQGTARVGVGLGRHVHWYLRPNRVPWHRAEDNGSVPPPAFERLSGCLRRPAPSAETIWRWAQDDVRTGCSYPNSQDDIVQFWGSRPRNED